MCEIKINDILTHYRSLQHEHETEIRVFDKPYLNGKSFFVSGQEAVLKTIEDLNKEKVRAYIGINERTPNGKTDADVIAYGTFCCDIDGVPHTNENKSFAIELAYDLMKYFKENRIHGAIAETAGGANVIISLKPRIKITKETKQELINTIQKAKKFLCEKFKRDRAEIDPCVFNLSRVFKPIGIYDWKRNGSTGWIIKPAFTPTENFLKWVNRLEGKETVKEFKGNLSKNTPKNCGICELALKEQFEKGARYTRLAPNVSAYIRKLPNRIELAKQFQAVQDPSNNFKNSLAEWDRVPSKFCCTALRRYAEQIGKEKICRDCLEAVL